jgi:hypothetical protein
MTPTFSNGSPRRSTCPNTWRPHCASCSERKPSDPNSQAVRFGPDWGARGDCGFAYPGGDVCEANEHRFPQGVHRMRLERVRGRVEDAGQRWTSAVIDGSKRRSTLRLREPDRDRWRCSRARRARPGLGKPRGREPGPPVSGQPRRGERGRRRQRWPVSWSGCAAGGWSRGRVRRGRLLAAMRVRPEWIVVGVLDRGDRRSYVPMRS